ncbi:MAG: T9SS type A sorting domain-containing protein, partial [Chitinophaga rupis]
FSDIGITTGIWPGKGNINANPMFTNGAYAGADGILGTSDDGMELQAGSPAIDAIPDSVLNEECAANDITGLARPIGPGADIGAYEANLMSVLAMGLTEFDGSWVWGDDKHEYPLLQWVCEQNSGALYSLERSSDGIRFSEIRTIKAIPGMLTYRYQDTVSTTSSGLYYYRLKITSATTDTSYSRIVMLSVPSSGLTVSVSPNPSVGGIIRVFINVPQQQEIGLRIFDVSGKCAISRSVILQKGPTIFLIDSHSLAKGNYFLHVSDKLSSVTVPIELR